MGRLYFLTGPTKKFSPQNGEKTERENRSYLINKNAHVQFLSFFFPFFFFFFGARDVASFSFSFSFSFFPFFLLFFPLHVAFSFFNFLGKGWHDASFFFFFSLIFPGGCLFFFFFFFGGGYGCDSCFVFLPFFSFFLNIHDFFF